TRLEIHRLRRRRHRNPKLWKRKGRRTTRIFYAMYVSYIMAWTLSGFSATTVIIGIMGSV
ncbi:hypothetical protein A2U01_0034064, partial [Trifolium medium]|nr:hypothetical protein [Trifolium medium]